MTRGLAHPRIDHPPSRGKALGRDEAVALARKVTTATGAPVLGGIAVLLHGGSRATSDIDIYSRDFWDTHQKLEAAGMLWDSEGREHLIERVPFKKDFAAKLPTHLRKAFELLVDEVHEPRRTTVPPKRFWKQFA